MPTFAAIAGASLFLVHPANVEAVAWISQLKSPASLALALGALCLHPRRPACAVLLFTAALFAKPTAAFALPVLVGLRLIERQVGSVQQTPKADAREWYWVGASLLAFLAFCVAEISAFEGAAGHLDPLDPDPFVTARTIVALFARYLAMAVAGVGTSTFHEPARAVSALDPWWLAGLALMVLCTVRVWTGLRLVWPVLRRKTEANPRIRERALESLCWIWVFAAFAPISQVFPFRYPMADRYLYSLLPGLIGAVLCALAPCWRKGGGRLGARAPGAAALGLALLFSFQAYARAGVWASPERVMLDAARHYPDGVSALQLRARAAARRGDREGSLAALRAAVERGYDGYEGLLRDAALAPLRDDPEFRSIVHAMAAFWIARASRSVEPSQADLLSRSRAHAARGEWAEAVRDLEHAIGQRGPLAGIATRELISARAHLRAAE
jgi:hypothetical protein